VDAVAGHLPRRPKLIRVAAAKADWWSWDGPIDRYGPLVEELQRACVEVGRDSSSVRLHAGAEAYFPENPGDFPTVGDASGTMATVTTAQDPEGLYATDIDWVLRSTPDDAIRQLRPMVDAGVGMFSVYFHDRRTVDLFARDVIAAFG
jgi:hypothetical protein